MAKMKNQNAEEAMEKVETAVEEAVDTVTQAEETEKPKKKFFKGVTLKGVGLGFVGALATVGTVAAIFSGKKTDDCYEESFDDAVDYQEF